MTLKEILDKFAPYEVSLHRHEDGTFSATTRAPTVGYSETQTTPEEALKVLYSRLKNAGYFTKTVEDPKKKWKQKKYART